MKLTRLALLAVALATVAGVALLAKQTPPAGAKIADAANSFLGALTPEQKKKATFRYDDPHRSAWFFTPQQDKDKKPTRKGLRLEELDAKQKTLALNLLREGLSTTGYDTAMTIISLEQLLADLEKNGAMVRNTGWYFVSIFGEPSNTGKWGWRIEGHHLSVNITLDKGEIVSATPILFAANPADVKDGPRKGLRPLPEIEDLAKKLIGSLDDEQTKVAKQAKHFPEIREGKPEAGVGAAVGIAAGKLNEDQKATLWKLIEAYASRMPEAAAKAELAKVKDAGLDKVTFGYCLEADKPGKPYTYRVQGPTFVVEFLNVQADSARNPANHIHSAWRRLPSDF